MGSIEGTRLVLAPCHQLPMMIHDLMRRLNIPSSILFIEQRMLETRHHRSSEAMASWVGSLGEHIGKRMKEASTDKEVGRWKYDRAGNGQVGAEEKML